MTDSKSKRVYLPKSTATSRNIGSISGQIQYHLRTLESGRSKISWGSIHSMREASEEDDEDNDMAEQTVKSILMEFTQETSFHAIKFFTRVNLSWIKRLFWLFCWLVSLTACVYYVVINISEYQTTATITSIDSTTYPVNQLRFPSVTFCNFNHIVKSRHPPKQEDVLGK
ncbi:hypothetical protein SK128_003506 [Halocaridina rubra]|uniref:Uncharacterized protein n=1 Tax=Halocaridina rubra TaxID=373956 RepID=A0AAN8ZNW1_HALRR